MLNDAYRTLKDRVARVSYLLKLEGYQEAEKKAPPGLLEEVFELNMQIEELKAAKKLADDDEVTQARAALEDALDGLREKLAEIDDRLFAQFTGWDAAVDENTESSEKKVILDRMSEMLSNRSYIRHLVHNIQEEF